MASGIVLPLNIMNFFIETISFKLPRISYLLSIAAGPSRGKAEIELGIETMLTLPLLCQNLFAHKRISAKQNKTEQKPPIFLPCLANKSAESRHFEFQNKNHSGKAMDHYFSSHTISLAYSSHLNLS